MLKKESSILLFVLASISLGVLLISADFVLAVTATTLPTVTRITATQSDTKVQVKWKKTTAKVTYDGFAIFRSEKKGVLGTKLGTISKDDAAGTHFTDTTVKSRHTYYYSVKYYRGKKLSTKFRQAKIIIQPVAETTTLPAQPTSQPVAVTPPAPARPSCQNGSCFKNDSKCQPVVDEKNPSASFSFVIAYAGLSQDDINTKGYDITRAQFYRSQYTDKYKDPDFGFIAWDSKFFDTRVGLFEIEPWKTFIKKLNAYYITYPLQSADNPMAVVQKECGFTQGLASDHFKVIVLKREATPFAFAGINTWNLEGIGTAFNHENGHGFGLVDEYFTSMDKNDLSASEVTDWNNRLPDCDFGHPTTAAEYQSGAGYCTKWCAGVDPVAYQKYNQTRVLYDQCESALQHKNTKAEWMDFCKNKLDFSAEKRVYETTLSKVYQGPVVGGNPSLFQTVEQACDAMFSDQSTNKYFGENIQNFCAKGTIDNMWNVSIGTSCMAGTGCYAGCGGFNPSAYGSRTHGGAFGDAFRPSPDGIMGGGFFGSSGPDFSATIHKSDSELPTYGAYGIYAITQKLNKLGITP